MEYRTLPLSCECGGKPKQDISARHVLNARPCYSLAMPTMPQKRLYRETSLGLLARVLLFGISEIVEGLIETKRRSWEVQRDYCRSVSDSLGAI
jgi:hypothetical protein